MTLAMVVEIPVCRKILLFLLHNSKAIDTARGIAEWWIQEDLHVTQNALDHLVEVGVVRVHTHGGMNFYSLTRDLKLQRSLRQMLSQAAE